MPLLLFVLLTFLPFVGANNEAVKVTAKPQPIYIEKGTSSQHLNFDSVVENLTDDTLAAMA